MKIAFRVLLLVALVLEVLVILLSNTVSSFHSLWFLTPVPFIGLALFLLFLGIWRDYRRNDKSWAASLSATSKRFGVPKKALALLVSEIGSLTSALGIFRPSKIKMGEYTVHKNLRTIVFLILGLCAVEITVVHLAVPSDLWRYILLIASIYAAFLLTGFYVSIRENPHVITPEGILLRHGKRLTCEIQWSHLGEVKTTRAGQGGDIEVDENGYLRIPVLSEVNVKLELEHQVIVEDLHKGFTEVSAVECYCDDKESFLKDIAKQRPPSE